MEWPAMVGWRQWLQAAEALEHVEAGVAHLERNYTIEIWHPAAEGVAADSNAPGGKWR